MSLLHTVHVELDARKGTWVTIARETGLGYSWLCKFGAGRYRHPSVDRVQQLADYFASHPLSAGEFARADRRRRTVNG